MYQTSDNLSSYCRPRRGENAGGRKRKERKLELGKMLRSPGKDTERKRQEERDPQQQVNFTTSRVQRMDGHKQQEENSQSGGDRKS